MNREGRAATTGNTYCGNLLWQSSQTLLVPDDANPVVQSDPDVMASAYRRGRRLLLVIGSYAKESVELPLRPKRGRVTHATDLETGNALPLLGGISHLTLAPHGFAIVELEVELLSNSARILPHLTDKRRKCYNMRRVSGQKKDCLTCC